MPRETGIYRRKDSNLLQWRIKAPQDLQSLYRAPWAHRCSLGTSDLREANRRAAQLRAQWLETFRQQRERTAEPITPEVGRYLAKKLLHGVLAAEDARVNDSFRKDLLRYQVRLGMVGMQIEGADAGIVLDGKTPGAKQAWLHYVNELKEPLSAKVPPQQPPLPKLPEKPRKLRHVFDQWKRAKDRSQDSLDACERALELYEQQTGNPPLHELRRDQGAEFRNWLLTQGFASSTARDKLNWVKSLLKYAYRDLEWLQRHPWEGLDIEERTENKRRPWTASQVKAFFGLPLFQLYELPKATQKNGGSAAYWIPLLGLYTGARIGELCQLRMVDVVTRDGVACISINDEAEGSTVKTEAGIREVPIHSELLRLGFLEYVETMRKAGEERLWPALKLRDGKPGGYFSAWFGELRRTLPEEVPDFHSLRHTVRSKMATAKPPVPEALQDRITGHEAKGSTGVKVYTHYMPVDLRDAVEAIRYPELELPKAFRAN